MDLKTLLKQAQDKNASDLHITENTPPVLRIDGKLCKTDFKPLTRDESKNMVYSLLSDDQKRMFEETATLSIED